MFNNLLYEKIKFIFLNILLKIIRLFTIKLKIIKYLFIPINLKYY